MIVKLRQFLFSKLFIITIFIIINLIFNFAIWKDLIFSKATDVNYGGDEAMGIFIEETSYRQLLKFKNPFTTNRNVFYPFNINYSLNDPATANALFFLVFRPFFDIHRTLLIIVILNIFLSNIIMYWLLQKLKISKYSSFVFSLVFGFMPFLSHRVFTHYSYTCFYFFPLIFLIAYLFIKNNNKAKKTLYSILLGVILSLTLLSNFYYFIMVSLAFIFFLIYFFITKRDVLIRFIFNNCFYFLLSGIFFIGLLIPWITEVFKYIYFEGLVKTPGFGGAIVMSADLLSFITPSEYNPFYKTLILKFSNIFPLFSKYSSFFFNSWERFVYPGVIIIVIYFCIFLKKIPISLWRKIKPYFLASLFFAILTLGPFLTIFNRRTITLDEGINLYFPLPFLLLHYIPAFGSLRVPTRFTPAFVFFASLTGAYVLNYFFIKINQQKRLIFLIFIFLVFFADQFYSIPSKTNNIMPYKIYSNIREDPERAVVLEVPFTVRDGFDYRGFVHAIFPMAGAIIHKKPIIGGYLARINPEIFKYYDSQPFISYILKTIDKGNYNPYKEKPRDIVIAPFKLSNSQVQKELNFLDIKYITLKDNEKYSPLIKKIIIDNEFKEKIKDSNYSLFERKLKKQNFERVIFGSNEDHYYTTQGFSIKEDGFRWVEGKRAMVFIKTDDIKKKKIVFNAQSFYQPQKIKIYLNGKYIGVKVIETSKKEYIINVSGKINSGFNTVFFKLSKSFKPSKVYTDEKDARDLSIKFFSLKIE